ncbi:MAG: hypothetical protein JWN17_593, partial [Frankiales bacterium]|nr:hypothetical protein [Frankiales bacterium]
RHTARVDVGLLVPVVAVVAALAVGGAAYRLERRRAAALRAFATEQGWSLVRRDDTWARELDGEPFGRGSGRRCEDVLTGTFRGRDVVAFAYSYRTHTTDGNGQRQTRVHRYSVALLRLPAPLPLVELQASWLPRVFSRGIELESEDFNARYRVRADDPRLAYDVLPARTMQLLLERPDVAVRLHGGCAVTWEAGRLDPEELLVRLETVSGLLDGVPSFVWKDRA